MLREDWEGLKGMHLTNVQIHETKLVELRERANKPTSAGDSNNPPPSRTNERIQKARVSVRTQLNPMSPSVSWKRLRATVCFVRKQADTHSSAHREDSPRQDYILGHKT